MLSPLAALKSAAQGLLSARQLDEAEVILAGGELVLAGAPEEWQMGSRSVCAEPLVLLLDPEPYVKVQAAPALLEQLQQALGDAVRSDCTELKGLTLCVRLPGVGRPWREVYRQAPREVRAEPPDADQVLAGAVALLQAEAALDDVELLSRSSLAISVVSHAEPGSPARALLHCELGVPAEELAVLEHDPARSDRVCAAIRCAGRQPLVDVAEVLLRARRL